MNFNKYKNTLFISILIFTIVITCSWCLISSPRANLWKWIKDSDYESVRFFPYLETELNKKEAEKIGSYLYSYWQKENDSIFHNYWDSLCIYSQDREYHMPFKYKIFGDEAMGDRSLYISLHGGGNAPAHINDSQWNNQINLYTPSQGVYVAPRAPENDWNMWFKPYMPYFYDELIQSAVAVMGVNPDKVYLTGYSAGGDGLYRIAPLMADRFASAAMMAGHPGDSSPLSLYNLPFALWMGANDDAYSRNFHAKEWGSMLDSLQLLYSTTDNLKFIHDVHIVEDKGHWMDRADTVAINWMSQFVRDSSPETIMWKNDNDLTPEYFYWAAIKDPSQRKNSLVVITRESNTFTIEKCSSDTLTIYLKDEIADLNKPVKVIFNNEIIFDSKVKRTISNIYESINERGDRNYIFSARIDLNIPQN